MRQSKYFLKTSKTFSEEDLKIISSKLLKQAGFIAESVAGRYYFLPIGYRVQQKIMAIIKEEMDQAGAQEMSAPILHPLELWQETNRTSTTGFELMKVKDRRESEFALGGTAEEMFVDLVRKYQLSYKDLPFHLYQFSTKFRDELRARGGLLRVREFIMKDGYSFHKDEADFKLEYEKLKQVYTRIFQRLGLETLVVESDNGYIGGEYCHEFVVESEIGETKFFTDGTYSAHEDVAKFKKANMNLDEAMQALQTVVAERGKTMEDGVKFHQLPLWRQIKDVLYVDEKQRFVLAIIRGDFEVNEVKLKSLIKSVELRHATDEEIRLKLNSEPGFLSPVNIKHKDLIIVADDSLATVKNMYGGANQKHRDLLNVNIHRDYEPNIIGDIALVKAGYVSLAGKELVEKKGIEVGNIFQLGLHYTNLMKGAVYRDEKGESVPYYMGCYGIGIGRTLATIVEKYNDPKGIMWPELVAPFKIHLLSLKGAEKEAEEIYHTLLSEKIEVLYDDRDLSAGAKFADSDLIGIPYRIVVSSKTLEKESVEVKKRALSETQLIKINELISFLQ